MLPVCPRGLYGFGPRSHLAVAGLGTDASMALMYGTLTVCIRPSTLKGRAPQGTPALATARLFLPGGGGLRR